MSAVEENELKLSHIFEYYSKLKDTQNKTSAYWKVMYNQFYSCVYEYFINYIYTEENGLQDKFLEAFSDDITHIKEDSRNQSYKDNFELFVIKLIESDTRDENLLSELKKHFNQLIKTRRKHNFWNLLSGGMKIGTKKLRAISKDEAEEQFEIHSESYVDSQGIEKSLLDNEEVVKNSNYSNRKNCTDYSMKEDKNDFEAILKDVETLFKEQRSDLKKTLTAIITYELLNIFKAYKVFPIETQIFMLKKFIFYDQKVTDFYVQQVEEANQKDIAGIIGKNTEQISKVRKKFFQEANKRFKLRKRLEGLLLESDNIGGLYE